MPIRRPCATTNQQSENPGDDRHANEKRAKPVSRGRSHPQMRITEHGEHVRRKSHPDGKDGRRLRAKNDKIIVECPSIRRTAKGSYQTNYREKDRRLNTKRSNGIVRIVGERIYFR